jgi:hypothetical protein
VSLLVRLNGLGEIDVGDGVSKHEHEGIALDKIALVHFPQRVTRVGQRRILDCGDCHGRRGPQIRVGNHVRLNGVACAHNKHLLHPRSAQEIETVVDHRDVVQRR